MSELPVREMVLYKHGVGFFMREGEISGNQANLTFNKSEINDVLKSLAVFDRAGGQVLGIHYQTPMDKAARLANTSINLDEHSSLRDLMRDLRGREVTCTVEVAPGSTQSLRGRIVGADDSHIDNNMVDNPLHTVLVTMLTETGVSVFPLSDLRSFEIHDAQSARDLSYFLDTSMSEDDRRTVLVRLSEGDHDLAVYYVAPSPTWRVSYRLVADSEEDGSGTAYLQGWGLFDNRLEEDIENAKVTLVAGQPISFIYDLYESRIPNRPTVEDESRIAPGPIEYKGRRRAALMDRLESSEATTASGLSMAEVEDEASAGFSDARFFRRAAAKPSAPPQAETKDAGEFFQYIVTTPVSVKRGDSALVPIIGSNVKYDRELLYNRQKLPDHPVVAMRFVNDTGLTLERGPVTIVEDSDYKGEAVVPFTKNGTEIFLPYAVELGVRVRENYHNHRETFAMRIRNKYAVFVEHHINETEYVIDNTTENDLTLLIESPITVQWELFETPEPDVVATDHRRWKVELPAGTITTFVRKERTQTERQRELRALAFRKLMEYLDNRWIDQATFDALADLLREVEVTKQTQQESTELSSEREEIYQTLEQLRANLQALQPTGDEANLRRRMLTQFESKQTRLEEIDRHLEELKTRKADAESRILEMIELLGEK